MKLAIDNNKLGSAIDRQDDKMALKADQILTRAQIRLQAEYDRKAELQASIAEEKHQVADLISQRDRLNALIVKGEANYHDAEIELRAVVGSIATMESEGITL